MKELKITNYVRIIAGSLVFLFSLLGYFINNNWLWITMFIGLNLFQFGFTGFCPLTKILKKMGIKE